MTRKRFGNRTPLPLVKQPIARRRLRTFADLDLGVVDVRNYLAEIAHVEPFSAARAFMK
jgi:hypothetical protein